MIRSVREALNSMGYSFDPNSTAKLSAGELEAINSVDPAILKGNFLNIQFAKYIKVVQTKPEKVVYLKGWFNRVRE